MLTKKSFIFFASTLCFLLFCAAPSFAQKKAPNSNTPPIALLSETEMNQIDVNEYEKGKIIEYISLLLKGKTNKVAGGTMEAKIAATLVKSLKDSQKSLFNVKKDDGTASKSMACVGSFCTTAKCNDLNYGDMWSALGLCVE